MSFSHIKELKTFLWRRELGICMITQWMFNMKQLNEAMINLDAIYVKSIINFIHLIILVLALKKLVDMSVKIQILENLFKTHYRDI